MTTLARLKPYNEKKGYVTRVYMINGHRFLSEKGWYEVPDGFAEQLKELHQDHYDEETPYLFDVASEEEAEKIDQKEEEARANARASARNPQKLGGKQRAQVLPINNAGGIETLNGDLTTEDLYNQTTASPTPRGPVQDDSEEDAEDAGRVKSLGRVGGPKIRQKQK